MDISFAPIIISAEVVMLAVMLVVLYGLLFENRSHGKRQAYFVWTILFCVLSLVFDSAARLLDGIDGILWLQKIVNCGSLIGGSCIVAAFAHYEIAAIQEKDPGFSIWYARAVSYSNAIAVLITIIGTITGYSFTVVDNVFLEGPLYRLCTYVIILSMIYMLILSWINYKTLGKHDTLAFFIYLIIPILTALAQLVPPYLELAYITSSLAGLIVYIMLQSGHIHELDVREAIMEELSFEDTLTGLLNRRAYEEKIIEALYWNKVGIVFGDVNGLKFVNDNLGHKAGDDRLIKFSDILLRYFPKECVFRISGDEFVIIQNIAGPDFNMSVNNLRMELLKENDIASIGVCEGTGADIMSLLKTAEDTMYKEKAKAVYRHPEYNRDKN